MDQLSSPIKPLNKFKQRALRFFHGKSYSVDSKVISSKKTELLAEEALSSGCREAPTALLSTLAKLSESENDWHRIKGVINQRLSIGIQGHGKNWIYLYKVTVLIEYLLKRVPLYLVDEISNSFLDAFILLCSFYYVNSSKVDRGLSIRNKARTVLYLLQNPETLLKERAKIEGIQMQEDELQDSPSSGFLSLPSPSSRGILVNQTYYSEPHSPTYADWNVNCAVDAFLNEDLAFKEQEFAVVRDEFDCRGCCLDENDSMNMEVDRETDASIAHHFVYSTHLSQLQLPSSFVRFAKLWKNEHEKSRAVENKCSSQFSMVSGEGTEIKPSPPSLC